MSDMKGIVKKYFGYEDFDLFRIRIKRKHLRGKTKQKNLII